MAQSRREKFSNGPEHDEISRVLNLREAQHELGLSIYAVYRAVKEGRLHAVQVGGKGRIYYPEWELRELASRLDPDPERTFNRRWSQAA